MSKYVLTLTLVGVGLLFASVGYIVSAFLEGSPWWFVVHMTLIPGGLSAAFVGAVWTAAAFAGSFFTTRASELLPTKIFVGGVFTCMAAVMLAIVISAACIDITKSMLALWSFVALGAAGFLLICAAIFASSMRKVG